jgi:hypothetical protein
MLVGVAGWARGRSSKLGKGLVVSAFTALIAVNVLGSFDTVREGAEVIQSGSTNGETVVSADG